MCEFVIKLIENLVIKINKRNESKLDLKDC